MSAAKGAAFLLAVVVAAASAANVTYDRRAIVIDGRRRLLVSGSIHYPRSTPEMWPDIINKAKDGGLDVIETYVFWDLHEPVRGQYDFSGRKDLVRFMKAVAAAGLYAHLRIGPYVCAEWNYGGFPVWLHFIPGIKFRTDNEPFKAEMQRFTAKIVGLMKQEQLYASQGGPIILSQIENEYGNVGWAYGPAATSYIRWAASMALSLDTGVPWVMCQQGDAPDPIINTCNGFYCDQFTPNSNSKPKMWTENWSGWFLSFGGAVPYRPVQDLAFAVARFYQRGGTFQNYYMYHGGTNFDRSTGGPFIATSYDYDAPIDEYGLIRQPKWGHLRDVHKAIKLCEGALLASDPVQISLGPNQEGHVYNASGTCAAFLANIAQNDVTVTFNGKQYRLPGWSVSILPDCSKVVLNTAQINAQETTTEVTEISSGGSSSSDQDSDQVPLENLLSDWSFAGEPVGVSKANSFVKQGLQEQINTTADASDYLWYSISMNARGDEPFLLNGTQTKLNVQSLGHVLRVFINGRYSGGGMGNANSAKVSLQIPINLQTGKNTIDLLSATVGLQNYGAFFDLSGAGLTSVKLIGGMNTHDLSRESWTYQIGLKGEDARFYDNSGDNSCWTSGYDLPTKQPLTWYKAKFNTPSGADPVAIVFNGMMKGEAWVNGQSIGRYWPEYKAPPFGCSNCDYRGAFNSGKCLKGCGSPSQARYHVPRSWLRPGGAANDLVIFEEVSGDPTKIRFVKVHPGRLCAQVSEEHPAPIDSFIAPQRTASAPIPAVYLKCPTASQVITAVRFASFGTPSGSCGTFEHGECSSPNALTVVEEACVGASSCTVPVSASALGEPCAGVTKTLAVEVECS